MTTTYHHTPGAGSAAARPSRRSLFGMLAASVSTVAGTRVSAIAIPWFVLVTTHSAGKTGLVVMVEMTPYVVMQALSGPLIDRRGPRLVSTVADVVSALAAASIPLLHIVGHLSLPTLLGIVAVIGTMTGPSNAAKNAMIPTVADASGMSIERVTGLDGTADRTAQIIAPAVAGGVIALVGPVSTIVVTAATFLVSAVLIAATAPRRHESSASLDASAANGRSGSPAAPDQASHPSYLRRLAEGFAFLRREPLLRSVVLMITVTNWLDAAYAAVLLPVWIVDNGYGAKEIGLLGTAFGLTATLGSLLATAWSARLPRRMTYLVGFTLAGAPRFVALALGAPLWLVLATGAVSGFGAGFINPVVSAIMFERIPRQLVGRVSSLTGSLSWAGIPLGGVSAAAAIAIVGITPALAVAGGLYLLATTLPGLRPEWRQMDRARNRLYGAELAREAAGVSR